MASRSPSARTRCRILSIAYAVPRPSPGVPGETVTQEEFAATTVARAGEILTREELVGLMTRGSAYAEFAERDKGMLSPGMWADIAVLSRDMCTCPDEALAGTESVLTMVGGKVVQRAHWNMKEPDPQEMTIDAFASAKTGTPSER